jgi:hypothetical protein
MLLRPEYLSQNLDRPLPTKDGGTLRTIRDACDYMTGMGKKRELRSHWQRACKLILAKEDVLTVSRALELALFMDAKLDVSKSEAGYEQPIQGTRNYPLINCWGRRGKEVTLPRNFSKKSFDFPLYDFY